MTNTARTFGMNELAGMLGVTRQTIDRWVKLGCPAVKKADTSRGSAWQFNIAEVMSWREAKAVEQAVGDTQKIDIDEAKRRKIAAEASLAELEVAREHGAVVEIENVANVVAEQFAAVRAKLLAIPPKCAPLVVSAVDLNEAKAVLEAAVHEALNELVGWAENEADERSRRRDPVQDAEDVEATA